MYKVFASFKMAFKSGVLVGIVWLPHHSYSGFCSSFIALPETNYLLK
jgi:hypothetical protein